jgi:hypothetical protein
VADGVFCCTFFKGVGKKSERSGRADAASKR